MLPASLFSTLITIESRTVLDVNPLDLSDSDWSAVSQHFVGVHMPREGELGSNLGQEDFNLYELIFTFRGTVNLNAGTDRILYAGEYFEPSSIVNWPSLFKTDRITHVRCRRTSNI